MSLETIITDFITDTPPGELKAVTSDIKTIINEPSKNLSSAYDELISSNFQLIRLGSSLTIVSSFNKNGSKYHDYLLGKKFNVDLEKGEAIDVEEFDYDLDEDIKTIDKNLSNYVEDHFPSDFHYTLVPIDDEKISIIIIDEKLNAKNYYNGKWLSSYIYDKSTSELKGEIKVNVHYYEEGNVRLTTSTPVEASSISIDKIVNQINKFEDDFEQKLLINVSRLNEEYFKNLRRQLPINRSKVQWGKSIKNYKLGQDAAGGKH